MGDESWNDARPGGVFRLDLRGNVTIAEIELRRQSEFDVTPDGRGTGWHPSLAYG
jgi:hypothetical protein